MPTPTKVPGDPAAGGDSPPSPGLVLQRSPRLVPRASFPASRQPSAGAPDVGASSAHARPASCPVVGASPVPAAAAAARPSSCPAPEPPPRPPVVLAPDSGPADTSDASPSPKKPRTVLAVASPPAAQPAAVPAAVPPEAAAAAAAAAEAHRALAAASGTPPAALLQTALAAIPPPVAAVAAPPAAVAATPVPAVALPSVIPPFRQHVVGGTTPTPAPAFRLPGAVPIGAVPTGCIPGFNQMTPNPTMQGQGDSGGGAEPSTPLISDAAVCGGGIPKRRRACTECHKAKAACEGDPCHRCVRLGKVCVTPSEPRRRRRSSKPSNNSAALAAAAAAQAAAATAAAAAAAAATAHAAPSEAPAILDDEDDFLADAAANFVGSLGTSPLRTSPLLASPEAACAAMNNASSLLLPKSSDDSPGSRAAPSHLAAAAFNALQPVGVSAAAFNLQSASPLSASPLLAPHDPVDCDYIVGGLTPSEVAHFIADVRDNL